MSSLLGLSLFATKGGGPAAFQKGLCIKAPKDFDQGRHQPGPSGLMTGANTGAVVAMKVFVEQQVIPPVRIALELLGPPEHRPPATFVAQKDPGQPVGDLAGN